MNALLRLLCRIGFHVRRRQKVIDQDGRVIGRTRPTCACRGCEIRAGAMVAIDPDGTVREAGRR